MNMEKICVIFLVVYIYFRTQRTRTAREFTHARRILMRQNSNEVQKNK